MYVCVCVYAHVHACMQVPDGFLRATEGYQLSDESAVHRTQVLYRSSTEPFLVSPSNS